MADVFIVNGAHLEYTKIITSEIAWWMMLFGVYILKRTEIKVKLRSTVELNKS